YGAHTFVVNGLITDCGRFVREGSDAMGWFDLSTLKEPYRLEGKKTMGLELAEQCDWHLPDVILYPTGGGTGLIGMSKAFDELEALGWLADKARPRMVSVQSDGCAPIVEAFNSGDRFAEKVSNPHTLASGLRVPAAVGDFMILDAVRASHGRAVAVDESRLKFWMGLANRTEGIAVCPEAAACVGALEELLASGWIKPDERVVIFNTGAVQKYPEVMAVNLAALDKDETVDWTKFAKKSSKRKTTR
ncbi:MAG: threonine synthase, partial [candidate division Zixibacteria bacterium]